MKLSVTERKTEIEKEVTIDIDVSKLEYDEKSDIITELFSSMSEEERKRYIDENDDMVTTINTEHLYVKNDRIRHILWILEGDVDHDELEKDLMLLIEKHNLQKEL